MEFTYDPQADAAYTKISDRTGSGTMHTVSVANPAIEDAGNHIAVDFDSFGQLMGIEILGARSILPPALIRQGDS